MSRVEEALEGIQKALVGILGSLTLTNERLLVLGQLIELQGHSRAGSQGVRTVDLGIPRTPDFISYVDDEADAKREQQELAHLRPWGIPIPDYREPDAD